ncbi:hypothetical protein MNB_SV-10-1221 [hydrothermal vent metagenome]|uniref:Uncharacterized protein n=1 Tax=hydrothermal vent metagenome TaxID=652676 RepID=A0A1W1C1V5_9ZZZZ
MNVTRRDLFNNTSAKTAVGIHQIREALQAAKNRAKAVNQVHIGAAK